MADNTQWLYKDVQENRKALSSNGSQLARRNYLRSLCAFYEVSLSDLREVAAKLLVDDFDLSGEWKLYEIFPLLDESARLDNNGKLDLQPNRIPFLSLVAYTLKTFAKQVGFEKEVLSDSRWGAFCQSIQIRHRITHPKLQTEVEITDDELKTIDIGLEWWKEINCELQNSRYTRTVGD